MKKQVRNTQRSQRDTSRVVRERRALTGIVRCRAQTWAKALRDERGTNCRGKQRETKSRFLFCFHFAVGCPIL